MKVKSMKTQLTEALEGLLKSLNKDPNGTFIPNLQELKYYRDEIDDILNEWIYLLE